MGYVRNAAVWVLIALLGVALIPAVIVAGRRVSVDSSTSTCVFCRIIRNDKGYRTTFVRLPVARLRDTACSRWYSANVEPRHDHVWTWSGYGHETDLWGTKQSISCGFGSPIWSLDADTQLAFYQHLGNLASAKPLFAELIDENMIKARVDENGLDRRFLTVSAIEAWAKAGFPGTWDGWWKSWYAERVAKHQKKIDDARRAVESSSTR